MQQEKDSHDMITTDWSFVFHLLCPLTRDRIPLSDTNMWGATFTVFVTSKDYLIQCILVCLVLGPLDLAQVVLALKSMAEQI